MIYGYLLERQMQHVPKHGKDLVRLTHDSLGTRSVRDFWPTTQRDVPVYVDVKTGTMYDAATGECLSSGQMRIVLDAEAKVTRKRKDARAREHDGWMNEARRAAA